MEPITPSPIKDVRRSFNIGIADMHKLPPGSSAQPSFLERSTWSFGKDPDRSLDIPSPLYTLGQPQALDVGFQDPAGTPPAPALPEDIWKPITIPLSPPSPSAPVPALVDEKVPLVDPSLIDPSLVDPPPVDLAPLPQRAAAAKAQSRFKMVRKLESRARRELKEDMVRQSGGRSADFEYQDAFDRVADITDNGQSERVGPVQDAGWLEQPEGTLQDTDQDPIRISSGYEFQESTAAAPGHGEAEENDMLRLGVDGGEFDRDDDLDRLERCLSEASQLVQRLRARGGLAAARSGAQDHPNDKRRKPYQLNAAEREQLGVRVRVPNLIPGAVIRGMEDSGVADLKRQLTRPNDNHSTFKFMDAEELLFREALMRIGLERTSMYSEAVIKELKVLAPTFEQILGLAGDVFAVDRKIKMLRRQMERLEVEAMEPEKRSLKEEEQEDEEDEQPCRSGKRRRAATTISYNEADLADKARRWKVKRKNNH